MTLTADDLGQLERWRDDPNAGLVALILARPAWHQLASCRGAGPSQFFPEARSKAVLHQKQKRAAEAEAVERFCADCTVRDECLSDAVARDDVQGIYGGLTPRERRRL